MSWRRELAELGKRGIDIAGSVVLLGATGPALGAAMIAVRATMGSPVLFRQRRPGRDGVPFTLYKLRTMNVLPEAAQAHVADRLRVTRLGRLLRSSSVDELPELFNVLRGDMSLVGPRPLLLRYFPYYTDTERRRFDVRPGLTGWAQVHGRNPSPGKRSLTSTCGTLTTSPCGWT